jgi:arsenate reductase
MERKKPKVLFLSTGNATRSQIAEGFLRALGSAHFDVMSAGVEPGPLNPVAIEVMKERGIDISEHEPTNVAQSLKEHFAYVITVCDAAKERSPIFPFTPRLLHWSIKDPAAAEGSLEERVEVFRHVRDEIEDKIRQFITDTAQTNDSQLSIP